MSAAMAAAARIEPIDRSMPAVRITKVMPQASTRLIDACCMTISRLPTDAKRSLAIAKAAHNTTSTGNMPSARTKARVACALFEAGPCPVAACTCLSIWLIPSRPSRRFR